MLDEPNANVALAAGNNVLVEFCKRNFSLAAKNPFVANIISLFADPPPEPVATIKLPPTPGTPLANMYPSFLRVIV